MTLLNEIEIYKIENDTISSELKKVLLRHLWYLNEKLVGLAFFDEALNVNEKKEMIKSLENKECSQNIAKCFNRQSNISNKKLSDFVSENTKILFQLLKLDDTFLKVDPSNWSNNSIYNDNKKKISHLKVVNDIAERGVALASSYNMLTKDESQQQNVYQVVENHRKIFPNADKATITHGLNKGKF